jgi:hypothetical protein
MALSLFNLQESFMFVQIPYIFAYEESTAYSHVFFHTLKFWLSIYEQPKVSCFLNYLR